MNLYEEILTNLISAKCIECKQKYSSSITGEYGFHYKCNEKYKFRFSDHSENRQASANSSLISKRGVYLWIFKSDPNIWYDIYEDGSIQIYNEHDLISFIEDSKINSIPDLIEDFNAIRMFT